MHSASLTDETEEAGEPPRRACAMPVSGPGLTVSAPPHVSRHASACSRRCSGPSAIDSATQPSSTFVSVNIDALKPCT